MTINKLIKQIEYINLYLSDVTVTNVTPDISEAVEDMLTGILHALAMERKNHELP